MHLSRIVHVFCGLKDLQNNNKYLLGGGGGRGVFRKSNVLFGCSYADILEHILEVRSKFRLIFIHWMSLS